MASSVATADDLASGLAAATTRRIERDRMEEFFNVNFMMLFVIVAIVVVLIFAPARRIGEARRTCRVCGAAHPTFARFCKRCGKNFEVFSMK